MPPPRCSNSWRRPRTPDGNYSTGERNNRSVFLERLGTVYREQGKTQPAVDTYRKMLELGGDSAIARLPAD